MGGINGCMGDGMALSEADIKAFEKLPSKQQLIAMMGGPSRPCPRRLRWASARCPPNWRWALRRSPRETASRRPRRRPRGSGARRPVGASALGGGGAPFLGLKKKKKKKKK